MLNGFASLGSLIASLFDALVLARSTTTIAPQRPAAASGWRVEPRASVSATGASGGIGGSF